jgi:hypothetical protein
MSDVRRGPRSASAAGHDVAGPGLQYDLPDAHVRIAALFRAAMQRAEQRSRIGKVERGMHTRQRTQEVGRDTDCAEGAGRGAAKGRAVSPVCRSGGRWRDRRTDAQHRPLWHSPFQPEGHGDKLWERETARDTRCQAVCVDETAKHCSSRTQSRSLAAEYKNSFAFSLHMAKTQKGSHLARWKSRCLAVQML